jgi:hypothetical protein
MAIWYILRLFGLFSGHLVHFMVIWLYVFLVWYVVPRKIWQPWLKSACSTEFDSGRFDLQKLGLAMKLIERSAKFFLRYVECQNVERQIVVIS